MMHVTQVLAIQKPVKTKLDYVIFSHYNLIHTLYKFVLFFFFYVLFYPFIFTNLYIKVFHEI